MNMAKVQVTFLSLMSYTVNSYIYFTTNACKVFYINMIQEDHHNIMLKVW